MKKILLLTTIISVLLVSCNDFLDTMPDKRAEVDTPEKIAMLLVSAYPTQTNTLAFEYMSDNITDNGPLYSTEYRSQTQYEAYNYLDITEVGGDCPTLVWQGLYKNIAAANQALLAIEQYGNREATRVSEAEALLCRAYGHFMLANSFCIAYNPVSSSTDPGIPYVESPETTVSPSYERGTVAEVYEKIARDIDAALKIYVEDFAQPKYHFNRRAAYAFAAEFYLFYGKYDKVIEYATEALGDDPSNLLRDPFYYTTISQITDQQYAYLSVDEPANFMMISTFSQYGRVYRQQSPNCRYGHNQYISYGQSFWSRFPFGSLGAYNRTYGSSLNLYHFKSRELWEVTNATAQTGYAHVTFVPFTADLTLAARAEAYAMTGQYDKAAQDLSYWYIANGSSRTYDADEIAQWYSVNRQGTLNTGEVVYLMRRYPIDSRFEPQPGMQENMLRGVLAMRNIEGINTGLRWLDIKRHGITVKHPVLKSQTEADTLTLAPYDPRTAIQLPADVLTAGLPANPR